MGFYEYQTSLFVGSDLYTDAANLHPTPILNESTIVIVLTWNVTAADADATLYTPWNCRTDYQTLECTDATSASSLNQDVADYGPETITIRNRFPGVCIEMSA